MPFQLTHEAERRWVLVLQQIELTRIAMLTPAPRPGALPSVSLPR